MCPRVSRGTLPDFPANRSAPQMHQICCEYQKLTSDIASLVHYFNKVYGPIGVSGRESWCFLDLCSIRKCRRPRSLRCGSKRMQDRALVAPE